MLPPDKHVAEIMKLMTTWDERYKFLRSFANSQVRALSDIMQLLVQIRKYDVAPDVMIYSNSFRRSFPTAGNSWTTLRR